MAHPSLLYDEMSGMENLRYFRALYGLCGRCALRPGYSAVGLDPELQRPVGQYSQGMRQSMSLARALLNDPKILLLDEPFSNVDIRSAREMVQLLGQMRDGQDHLHRYPSGFAFGGNGERVYLDGERDSSSIARRI